MICDKCYAVHNDPNHKCRMRQSTKLLLASVGLSVLMVMLVAAMLPTWLRLTGKAAAEIQNSYESARVDAGAR